MKEKGRKKKVKRIKEQKKLPVVRQNLLPAHLRIYMVPSAKQRERGALLAA
jgi:hypothetical protein